MGSRGAEMDDQSTAENTPQDVAALYSWANLQGAKYRDYSATRREYRAQVRYRAAKDLLERELQAQADAILAAEQAEREAFAAEAVALSQDANDSHAQRSESLRSAEAATRRAAAERVEAARRAESSAHATVLALRAEREISEARASAREQAMIYAESEARRRQLAGPQPYFPGGHAAGSWGARPGESDYDSEIAQQSPLFEDDSAYKLTSWPSARRTADESPETGYAADQNETVMEQSSPAWLFGAPSAPRVPAAQAVFPAFGGDAAGGDTLQDSRERVAARWFALKGVFEQPGAELPAIQASRMGEVRSPLLAVFSLAGGVGKTSLVATLGRALSSKGEKVVVADTTSHGLLPFYFGARAMAPGEVRSFPPPPEGVGEAVSLAIYDATEKDEDERQQALLAEEIVRIGAGNHRLLLDLNSGSSWLVRRLANLYPTVLVPIAPDMNSVVSLEAVENVFQGITGADGRPVLPFYVVNQFDAARPLHLDIREVFRRKLGGRLLRCAIRASPLVSEALAEGMTVVDYAPSAPVSQDYLEVAAWLRSIVPLATAEERSLRWGEQ
jgi:cellulose synthase operon protein YhjQ